VGSRVNLHYVLTDILGSNYVYFQPPESIKLEYPCILYERVRFDGKYANNKKYAKTTRYQVTVIDLDPDSDVLTHILDLPLCSHDRHFAKDGLNHDVFELYY
jgi:hypothetical protein